MGNFYLAKKSGCVCLRHLDMGDFKKILNQNSDTDKLSIVVAEFVIMRD
jgi:hypothetical protein